MQKKTFSREERIRKTAEFQRVRKEGKRLSAARLVLYVLPNELKKKRLGLSVTKHAGPAVRRNRIKRLLREFFRLNKDLFPDSTDILISVKNSVGLYSYGDVEKELRGLVKKFGRDESLHSHFN